MTETRVRLGNSEDWAEANALHNDFYGHHRSLAEWEWEFFGPLGEDPLVVVAERGGRILGTQAVIPIEMVDRQAPLLTGKSEETLVAPELRGQGVFERMYEVTIDESRRRGIDIIWGFTPAAKAFRRVGFETPWRTGQLFFPLTANSSAEAAGLEVTGWRRTMANAAGLVAATGSKTLWRARQTVSTSRGDSSVGLEYESTGVPPSDSEALTRRFSQFWGLATISRSEAYMRWRVTDNPHVKSRMVLARHGDVTVGWCLYSVDANSNGYIVDLIVAPTEQTSRSPHRSVVVGLLTRALRALRASGAKSVRMWTNQNQGYELSVRRTAMSLGFWHLDRGEPAVFRHVGGGSAGFSRVMSGFHSRLSTEGLVG